MEEGNKIYLGNLDYGATEDDLRKLFDEKGMKAMEVTIISDNFSGRSKGFGFAEFESEELAQQAIHALDGHDLNGRKLTVSKARKRKPRSEGGFGGGGGGRGYRDNSRGGRGGGSGGGGFRRDFRY
ncbi:RNA recognition motif domain-containing protein [Candidatus Omnitrophota bacterium]